eukprot:384760-Pyramimonas_sp.AAC.2
MKGACRVHLAMRTVILALLWLLSEPWTETWYPSLEHPHRQICHRKAIRTGAHNAVITSSGQK